MRHFVSSAVAFWATLISLLVTQGASMTSKEHLKKRPDPEDLLPSYDFIIVGGGTAGLVLANRLTESENTTVLVLEAGPVPTIVAAYQTPGGNQLLGGTAIQWGFTTTPQPNLYNRILPYHRGKGLGGSSDTNGLFYGRGSASVYDRWVSMGNPGWGWDDVYPLFVKSTHFNPPNPDLGFDQTYETWDPSAYSDGPLEIGFQGYVPTSNVGFMKACEAANIPVVHELNSGNGTGVKQGTGTLDSRIRRSSSYDSYLAQAAGRPNLHVLHYAPVQRLILDTAAESITATGVVFMDEPSGRIQNVTATKEVILSAGAFHSPQLLMVSGIGPAAELEGVGITPVLVNENIGQSMNDHSVFSVYARADPSASTTSLSTNYENLAIAQEQYYTNLSGPYTAPSGITNGFQKLSIAELEEIGAHDIITEGLANQSHVEYLYESIFYPGNAGTYYTPLANESYISLTASSLVALSRGNVTIGSPSMADAPLINPNYLDHPTDSLIEIQAFKYLRKMFAHPALSQYTIGPNNGEIAPGHDVQSDEDILEYIKSHKIANWHASGTNAMLPEADGGVVDPRLRVYGMNGLRVIDCSIIPFLPDVNIVGAVYMIGEKGAQMIKEDWGL